jgi:hypothetical protein
MSGCLIHSCPPTGTITCNSRDAVNSLDSVWNRLYHTASNILQIMPLPTCIITCNRKDHDVNSFLYEPDYSHISQKVRFCVPPSARMETLHLMWTLKLCVTGWKLFLGGASCKHNSLTKRYRKPSYRKPWWFQGKRFIIMVMLAPVTLESTVFFCYFTGQIYKILLRSSSYCELPNWSFLFEKSL